MANRNYTDNEYTSKRGNRKSGRNISIFVIAAFIVAAYYGIIWYSQQTLLDSTRETTQSSSEEPDSIIETQTTVAKGSIVQTASLPGQSEDAQIAEKSVNGVFEEAQKAYQEKDWDSAIAGFETVRTLDNTYAASEVTQLLADAYFESGVQSIDALTDNSNRFEVALVQFRNALNLVPDDKRIKEESDLLNTYLIGERAIRLGSLQQALDVLLPLYEKSPDYLANQISQKLYETYIELGDRAMRKGNFQVGIDYFGRADDIEVADKSEVKSRLVSVENVKAALVTPTPIVTPTPTVTLTPTVTATIAPEVVVAPVPTTQPAKCLDPRAVILSPQNGEVLSGFVTIIGAAFHDEFKYYKVEYAEEFSSKYSFIFSYDQEVQAGSLALWNSTLVPNGIYKIRITVVERDGNYPPPCEVTIRIKNQEN